MAGSNPNATRVHGVHGARRPRVLIPALVAGLSVWLGGGTAHASTLVADWEMNEGPGATTMVDSADGNTGTLHNVTVSSDGFYTFNGVDSTASATQGFDIGGADISFTARLRFNQIPSSSVGDYDIVRGAPTGKWKLEIVRRNAGKTAKANCHFAGTGGGTQLTAGPSLADGNWHTVTCTKTTNSVLLTVDGQQFSKSFAAGAINTTGKEILLGGQSSGADEYLGDLDSVQVSVG